MGGSGYMPIGNLGQDIIPPFPTQDGGDDSKRVAVVLAEATTPEGETIIGLGIFGTKEALAANVKDLGDGKAVQMIGLDMQDAGIVTKGLIELLAKIIHRRSN